MERDTSAGIYHLRSDVQLGGIVYGTLLHRMSGQNGPPADLAVVGRYNTPAEIPNARVIVTSDAFHYEDMTPMYAADGAPIAATGAGTWGQLYSAGRLY